jgi:hypothetical protein
VTSPAAAATPPATLLSTPSAPAPETPKPTEAAPAAQAAKPAGAPEAYADFKMPEGVEVDTVALTAFAPVLKGLNLSQEQAQGLVDVYAAQTQRQATDFAKQLENPEFATQQAGLMLQSHRDAWATAVKADKDIGGANFDSNVQTAQRAIARFGTPELQSLLNTTGLGNHPALVKLFVAVGKQIREDVPQYDSVAGGRKSNAEVFYPSAAGA